MLVLDGGDTGAVVWSKVTLAGPYGGHGGPFALGTLEFPGPVMDHIRGPYDATVAHVHDLIARAFGGVLPALAAAACGIDTGIALAARALIRVTVIIVIISVGVHDVLRC